MRHLLLVEIDTDKDISGEQVQMMFAVSVRRSIAEECKAEDKLGAEILGKRSFPFDIRDLNLGAIKTIVSFNPIKSDEISLPLFCPDTKTWHGNA